MLIFYYINKTQNKNEDKGKQVIARHTTGTKTVVRKDDKEVIHIPNDLS